ncbi:MAG: hypothetical protein WD801_04305 [Gemmatimonadaceae bacterium]
MTTIEKWILALVLIVGFGTIGVVLFNFSRHLARIDENGRELTTWATRTAAWTTELRTKHLAAQLAADHASWKVAPDHVQPPPDPPPEW